MDLLGREKELAVADAAISAVGEGGPRALAVMGEAGIGKSALLQALRDRARDAGLLVLAGRAAEHERDVPFGLVVDALDDHVATMHHRRVQTIGPELAALLLDDLHWADEASVELVLHLLRRPPAGPVLVAFAMRPVDPARRLLDAVRSGQA